MGSINDKERKPKQANKAANMSYIVTEIQLRKYKEKYETQNKTLIQQSKILQRTRTERDAIDKKYKNLESEYDDLCMKHSMLQSKYSILKETRQSMKNKYNKLDNKRRDLAAQYDETMDKLSNIVNVHLDQVDAKDQIIVNQQNEISKLLCKIDAVKDINANNDAVLNVKSENEAAANVEENEAVANDETSYVSDIESEYESEHKA